MFENLTEQNFALYAAKSYENPSCVDILEFQEDLNRIKYIKRLFKRYEETGDLKDRLIINHLVVIYNVFEKRAATRMLALKLSDHLNLLKPFLAMLGFWPRTIDQVNGVDIDCDGVPVDMSIVDKLRQI